MHTSTDPRQTRPGARSAEASRSEGSAADEASPVFVDTSGKRRKGWRRVTIAVVGILCGYTVLLGVSFAGGPIPPAALLPVPGVPGNDAPAPAKATTGAPAGATPDTHSATGASRGAAGGGPAAATRAASTAAAKPGATTTNPPQPTTAPTTALQPTPTATSAATTTHGHQTAPPSHSHSKTP